MVSISKVLDENNSMGPEVSEFETASGFTAIDSCP
jgi:hypothetical protein